MLISMAMVVSFRMLSQESTGRCKSLSFPVLSTIKSLHYVYTAFYEPLCMVYILKGAMFE